MVLWFINCLFSLVWYPLQDSRAQRRYAGGSMVKSGSASLSERVGFCIPRIGVATSSMGFAARVGLMVIRPPTVGASKVLSGMIRPP